MRVLSLAASAIVLMAFSTPAHVHHSGAMFDTSKQVTVTGRISEFNWNNPHASFKVDVTNSDGVVEVWAVEMGSPNNLIREGWKRTTIKPGDEVTVTVKPLRDGRPGGLYVGITLADGHSLGQPEAP
jgi:hypothetical protein